MLHVLPRNPADQEHLTHVECWCEPDWWESPDGVPIAVHQDTTSGPWGVGQTGDPPTAMGTQILPPRTGDPETWTWDVLQELAS